MLVVVVVAEVAVTRSTDVRRQHRRSISKRAMTALSVLTPQRRLAGFHFILLSRAYCAERAAWPRIIGN